MDDAYAPDMPCMREAIEMPRGRWLARIHLALSAVLAVLAASDAVAGEAPAPTLKHAKLLSADTRLMVHIADFPIFVEKAKASPWGELLGALLESEHYKDYKGEHPRFEHVEALAVSLAKELPKAFTGALTIASPYLVDGRGFNPLNKPEDLVALADVNAEAFLSLLDETIIPCLAAYTGQRWLVGEEDGLGTIGPEGKEPTFFFVVDDDLLAFSGSRKAFEFILHGKGDRLAVSPVFVSALSSTKTEGDILLFADLNHVWEFARHYGAMVERQAAVEDLLSVSGLDGVSALAGTASFHREGVSRELVFHAPDGLKGILRSLNRPPAESGVEKHIPEEFSFFVRSSLGARKDAGIAMVLFELSFHGLDASAAKLGIRVEYKDGLPVEDEPSPWLGSQVGWGVKFPRDGESFQTRSIVEVSDREKFESILEQEKQQTDSEENGPEAPVRGGYFVPGYYIAYTSGRSNELHPDDAKRRSILERERYKGVFSHLPNKGVIAIYEQTKAYHDFELSQDRTLMGLWIADYRDHPASLRQILVHELFEHLADSGMVVTADEKSVRVAEFSEFGIAPVRWPREMLFLHIVLPTFFPRGFGPG